MEQETKGKTTRERRKVCPFITLHRAGPRRRCDRFDPVGRFRCCTNCRRSLEHYMRMFMHDECVRAELAPDRFIAWGRRNITDRLEWFNTVVRELDLATPPRIRYIVERERLGFLQDTTSAYVPPPGELAPADASRLLLQRMCNDAAALLPEDRIQLLLHLQMI